MRRSSSGRAARTLLMSIAPAYADQIYEGTKRHEYRRTRIHCRPGDLVKIYETAPVSAITGSFVVGSVIKGSPSDVLARTGDTNRSEIVLYLDGASHCAALVVTSARRWARTRHLRSLPAVKRAPQSYVFLD